MKMTVLFFLLILLCFIVTFISGKKDLLFKRFFNSFFNALYITAFSFFVAAPFWGFRYELQNIYPNFPIAETFSFFLAVFLTFCVPFIYIIVILIRINKTKLSAKSEK